MPARPIDIRALRPVSDYDTVFEPIITAAADRPFVVAQLGQSLDGRIATPTGASRWINGAAALDHLHRLRAHVDAVVVGVNTVLADDPLLTVRRVPGRHPVRVVIDPHGRLAPSARCLSADGVPCLVVHDDDGPTPSCGDAIALPAERGRVDPAAIARALFDRGLRRILVEGGASTVSEFINARMVDRIHLLVAPIILGSGTTGLSLAPIAGLDQALRPATTIHRLDDGDVLFDCDLRRHHQG